MHKSTKIIREVTYDPTLNIITLYSYGPDELERPLTAGNIIKALECYPSSAVVVMDTVKGDSRLSDASVPCAKCEDYGKTYCNPKRCTEYHGLWGKIFEEVVRKND